MMLRLSLLILAVVQLSGCASILHGNAQPVHVVTLCNGRAVPSACTAQNAKGIWHFTSPGIVEVQKDFTHLDIVCKAPYFSEISAKVPAMLNLSVAGNLLLGGLVGAGVDTYRGASFAYSQDVRILYPACKM